MARQRLEEYQRALQIRYNMTSTSLLPAVTPPGLTHQSLHSAQSVHLPAPLQLPTSSAVSAYITAKSQTSVEVPTRESDMQASPGSSFRVGSKLLPDEVNTSRNQRPDVTAWLTDNIMERVTEHLPEKVRPSSSNAEPMPYKMFTTHHSVNVPLQPFSGPVQSISSSITGGEPPVQGHADTMSETFLHSSLQMGSLSSREDDLEMQRQKLQMGSLSSREDDLERQRRELQMGSLSSREEDLDRQRQHLQKGSLSSREDDLERQRRDLQEVQRRVLKQRQAVALQQRQQEEQRHRQEVQMRRQKAALQALIRTDAQVSEGTITPLVLTVHYKS